MRNFRVLLILTLVFLLSGSAFAQDDEDYKWRNFEVTVTAGLAMPMGELKDWNDSLGAKTDLNYGISGGYYFNNRLCVGAYFNYTSFGIEEPASGIDVSDFSYKLYKFGGYVKYAIGGESYWEPYGKIRLGATFPKFATWIGADNNRMREVSYDPEISGGIDIGLLYYTSDFGGLYLQVGYNYERLSETVGESFEMEYVLPEDATYFSINAGATVFFGPE